MGTFFQVYQRVAMRRIRLLLSFLSLSLCAQYICAQNWEDLPNLKEIKGKKLLEKIEPKKNEKDGRWGYVNPEGKYTIKPIFTDACPYEGNVARVRLDSLWGVISNKGLFQVYPMFKSLERFSSDSLAVCSVGKKYGLIDVEGKVIVEIVYDSFEYADYGYIVAKDGLLGTYDHTGNVLLQPQFEHIELLDRANGVSQVKKDGKWGLVKDGKELLVLKWDKPLEFLRSGSGNAPDLYLACQNGAKGVVSLYGDYVVPPVYDKIELSSSGDYYVTSSKRRYGAISLKMIEIIPPIMDSKPFLGENIFKVHDEGDFYCANVNGSVEFGVCADLYQMFKPEEYVTTKYFPQWAKTHIIEENNQKRIEEVNKATLVCSKMALYDYKVESAAYDPEMPEGVRLHIPADANNKYGILRRGVFRRSSDSGVLYRANEDSENGFFMERSAGGDYVLRMEDYALSVNEAVRSLNIREFSSFYPKEYAILNEDVVMVSFAFIRSADQVSYGLVETEEYMLPVASFPINVFTGKPDLSKETTAVISFSLDSLKAVSCLDLSGSTSNLLFSDFGGFYSFGGSEMSVDNASPLRKYDRYGRLDWEYTPLIDETFYDIEETENYIYLCGSVKEGNVEKPLLKQLSKRGVQKATRYGGAENARYTGVICNGNILYMKSSFLKGTPLYGSDYYATYSLDDLSDNVGVWYKCVWDEWGTGVIGGMGLMDHNEAWLCTPNITEQMSTSYDWEFGSFSGGKDYLVVRHHGNYGLIGKNGEILIDPKYESLEPLANPLFYRARKDGVYGVVDINDRVIVPFEHTFVGNMNEDIIVVSKDKMFGCYDKDGKIVVPLEYEEIREYVGGMARIRFKNRFGFIDKKGEMVVAPFSDEVENFSEGFTLVNIKGKMGFVSLAGDWIAPPMYDAGLNFSGGLAPLAMNGKYGYIDKSGEFVIKMQFDDAKEFSSSFGIACVSKKGKWGVINAAGTTIIPVEFDKVKICADGYVYVEKGGKSGIYTHRGKLVFEPMCDSIEIRYGDMLFRHGVANARMNGNRVKIDEYGNIIYQYSMLTK